MKDFKKNAKPMFYACVLPKLIGLANDFGYALAIHGSLSSDLDLIAVRWREECMDPQLLVDKFKEFLSGYCFGDINESNVYKVEVRFGNQTHYALPIAGDWFVDLTVIDVI